MSNSDDIKGPWAWGEKDGVTRLYDADGGVVATGEYHRGIVVQGAKRRALIASAPTLKEERDALARTVRDLCGQFVNSHGRGKIICLCCDVVSDDSGPLLHEPECEVAEACSLLAKLEGGR